VVGAEVRGGDLGVAQALGAQHQRGLLLVVRGAFQAAVELHPQQGALQAATVECGGGEGGLAGCLNSLKLQYLSNVPQSIWQSQ